MDDSIVDMQGRCFDLGGAEIEQGNIMRGLLNERGDDLSRAMFSGTISLEQ